MNVAEGRTYRIVELTVQSAPSAHVLEGNRGAAGGLVEQRAAPPAKVFEHGIKDTPADASDGRAQQRLP